MVKDQQIEKRRILNCDECKNKNCEYCFSSKAYDESLRENSELKTWNCPRKHEYDKSICGKTCFCDLFPDPDAEFQHGF